ncbi:CoA-binding protein, partial [Devosia sp.]|uniref:CoA-binding protein n=1 Tax=Devosia sp. TaxID=1871048 RepID=UPI002EEB4F19
MTAPVDQALGRALLAPRSVAIVGASADPTKTSSRPLRYLLESGFAGKIYPVNPRADEILGQQAWASIADLPEVPDLAFILLPNELAIDAVAQCGARGIRAAIVLASGFSEAGAEGRAREARLLSTAAAGNVRLLGPSSLGLANFHENLVLTGNAAFAEPGVEAGGVFCASQSGSMIGALMSRGKAKGIGFASLVSVGGEADISLGALCEATLDDPRVTSYMLFLESFRDSESLRRFAVGAARRGKPIAALKLGRSRAAAEIAVSHTGALAGDDDLADAFLSDCGIARVETIDALLEVGSLLRRVPVLVPERAKRPV